MKKRVVVGLSGGVDSSVAALLLKEQGYEVIGLFMRNWDSLANNDVRGHLELDGNICTQEKDFNDAKAIAQKLDIPIHRVDFVQEYWDEVFTKFIEEYKKSNTPNPDILCNKYIKFDKFLNYALKKFDTDYIATGHYADVEVVNGKATLLKCHDEWKDQTYFLAGLKEEQLRKVLFPLANIDKTKVREIASLHKLITAEKKDSTGICFIGKRKIKDFLQNYIKIKVGQIVDIEYNKVLGPHDGTMFYAIGQRFGLDVGGLKEPIFVCGKDIEKNVIYTAPLSKQEKYLDSNKCIIKNVHWISGESTYGKMEVKFRHGLKSEPVLVNKLDDLSRLELKYEFKRAVTPGQACVLYIGRECIGHGIVEEAYRNDKKLY